MKKILCFSVPLALVGSLVFGAAIRDGYVTRSATATTNTAEVFFPQNPTKAIRLVSWDVTSDTNNNTALTFLGGTMPITILGMINVTNLLCYSNNLVVTNAVAIIQRSDDTIFSVSILGTNQMTNIVISATNSIAILTNDVLWVCTNIASTTLGFGTNAVRLAGEALFQVQRRAPLALRLTNGLNGGMRINSATVHYDDNAP